MKISKSIILPEWEKIEDLDQASDILHKITEAFKDHNLQNYDDSIANYRRVTTGRIQSQDGETYFDLDSGVIKGEIVFRKGSSGLSNIEEASPGDWDNAFRLASAVCGDSDFTLISGGKIITSSVAVGAFNSDVVARIFGSGTNKTNIEAWMKSGAITYIDGAKIYTGSITATQIAASTITVTELNFTPVLGTDVIAKINASVEGIRIEADNINITGSTTFAAGYNPTGKIASAGAAADVNANVTTINGGKITALSITASQIQANAITAGKINVANLAAVSAILGSVSAGNIQGTRLQIGGGTNEDIYFEDSGIRFYDYGTNRIRLYKSGLALFDIQLNTTHPQLGTSSNQISLANSGYALSFYHTGTLQLPNLASNPAGVAGGICMVSGQLKYWNGSSWVNA